jgi:hypothetical protein
MKGRKNVDSLVSDHGEVLSLVAIDDMSKTIERDYGGCILRMGIRERSNGSTIQHQNVVGC